MSASSAAKKDCAPRRGAEGGHTSKRKQDGDILHHNTWIMQLVPLRLNFSVGPTRSHGGRGSQQLSSQELWA